MFAPDLTSVVDPAIVPADYPVNFLSFRLPFSICARAANVPLLPRESFA
jgi:hypothetical protein